jgi:hypothetical protein
MSHIEMTKSPNCTKTAVQKEAFVRQDTSPPTPAKEKLKHRTYKRERSLSVTV